jgi:hypothetical protein
LLWCITRQSKRPSSIPFVQSRNCDNLLSSLFIFTNKHTNMPVFFLSFRTKLRMSLKGCIVYLLLTYNADTHKACSSDLVYLVTQNPFTLLLGREWTYVATVHILSHQATMQASDQLHMHWACWPTSSRHARLSAACRVEATSITTVIKE